MIFKEWTYECGLCGAKQKHLHWDTDPTPTCACGGSLLTASSGRFQGVSVIDDQLDGGPRMFENLGHEPVWVESKSQLKREMDARGLQHAYRHTQDYYDAQRKRHDEERRDTGGNREY